MKNLFHYCVYRIASAYKKTMMQGYICQGYFLMFVAFTFYALALAECALSIFDLKINRTLIIVFCIPAIIGLLFFEKLFPNHQAMFKEYETKYKNERFRWMKGLLILLFLVISLVSYIIALIAFELP